MFAVQTFPCMADEGEGDVNNIKLYKKIEPVSGEEDTYLITLNSFVTGTKLVTEVTKPVDVTLVLDVSTSMSATCNGNAGEYLLSSFVKLTTGDNIGVLHTDFSKQCNHYNQEGQSIYSKNGTLRYRLGLNGAADQYNLLYHNNAWYYGAGTTWNNGNGWTLYSERTAAQKKSDIIYTDVKIDLLQEACRVFVNQIATSAAGKDKILGTADDIDHRIGFATFCGNLTQWVDITPIHTLGKATMVDVHDGNENAGIARTVTIEKFIEELYLHQNGDTNPNKAFDQAYREYTKLNTSLSAEDLAERSRVSVMFTDGKPQGNGITLNTILTSTKNLKVDYSAKVFTVGIFSFNDNTEKFDGCTIKQYMEYASSYYPNCTSKENLGTRSSDGVAYYQKSDGSDLSAIFKSIAQAAGADTYKLTDSDSAAIDVMSDDFEIPSGTLPKDVTMTMWVCTNGDLNHIDADENGVRYRDGYEFVPYKLETTDTDRIYDGDHPTATVNESTQRISVTGFNYSIDDVTTISGTTVTVNTYGNWVGKHADGHYAGKMLEVSFKVKLKAGSMGGFGLPSNKTSSGIYVNKGTAANPDYQLVAQYPLPVVNVPSIIIRKEGLRFGESAVFTVTRKTANKADGTEETLAVTDSRYIKYNVILSQNNADDTPCFIVIKDLGAGTYEVTESAAWSWTYEPSSSFATTQSFNLHEPIIPSGFEDIEEFKADIMTRQSAATYGATTNATERNKEENRYYVTGSIEQDSNDTSLHLLFKFVNAKKSSSLPLNDEAFTVNVFGTGGGSAEYGGVDPEVVVGD